MRLSTVSTGDSLDSPSLRNVSALDGDSEDDQSRRGADNVRWNVGAFVGEDVLRETDVSEGDVVWMIFVDGTVRFTKAVFFNVSWVWSAKTTGGHRC